MRYTRHAIDRVGERVSSEMNIGVTKDMIKMAHLYGKGIRYFTGNKIVEDFLNKKRQKSGTKYTKNRRYVIYGYHIYIFTKGTSKDSRCKCLTVLDIKNKAVIAELNKIYEDNNMRKRCNKMFKNDYELIYEDVGVKLLRGINSNNELEYVLHTPGDKEYIDYSEWEHLDYDDMESHIIEYVREKYVSVNLAS